MEHIDVAAMIKEKAAKIRASLTDEDKNKARGMLIMFRATSESESFQQLSRSEQDEIYLEALAINFHGHGETVESRVRAEYAPLVKAGELFIIAAEAYRDYGCRDATQAINEAIERMNAALAALKK